MPLYTSSVKRVLESNDRTQPSFGTVVAIGPASVSLRIKGSSKLWKNVPIVGDIGQVSIGDDLDITWVGKRPRAMSLGSATKRAKTVGIGREAGGEKVTDYPRNYKSNTVEDTLVEILEKLREITAWMELARTFDVTHPNDGGVYGYMNGDLRILEGLFVGATYDPETATINLTARSVDPADPAEGCAVIWLSDGTDYGGPGDLCWAETHSSVTTQHAF